jgi:hypothetical protein
MSELELMRVRALLAESRADSASRHSQFLSEYADLVWDIANFWRSAELVQKIEAFRERSSW